MPIMPIDIFGIIIIGKTEVLLSMHMIKICFMKVFAWFMLRSKCPNWPDGFDIVLTNLQDADYVW